AARGQPAGESRLGPPRIGERAGLGRAVGESRSTAAATSTRPDPKTALGTAAPGNAPQSWTAVSGTAERRSTSAAASGRPINCGTADNKSAAAPVTCGAEPEVPEKPVR